MADLIRSLRYIVLSVGWFIHYREYTPEKCMSTPTGYIFYPTENVLCGTCFVVQKENLGDFIKRVRESKNLSLEDVRVKSRLQLATSYVNRIENNQVPADVISIGKLTAL